MKNWIKYLISLTKLAIYYFNANKVKALLIVLCITTASVLPLSAYALIDYYQKSLNKRAQATPYVLGSRGDRFDLVLNSLYFSGQIAQNLSISFYRELRESSTGIMIPMLLGNSAERVAVVGTNLDYFAFRGLEPASGDLPVLLGEAVLGNNAARKLGLVSGDKILTDAKNPFDLTSGVPLLLNISGILAKSNSPDDDVIFTDIKTAWVIHGLGHGHDDLLKKSNRSLVRKFDGENVVGNASLKNYQEITPDNLASFHFHGEDKDFPISSIIFVPSSQKDKVVSVGKLQANANLQILDSQEIVSELMLTIFKIKKFFDASLLANIFFIFILIVIIIMLSYKIRKAENQLIANIGASQISIFALQALEIIFYLLVSVGTTTLVVLLTRLFLPNLQFWFS